MSSSLKSRCVAHSGVEECWDVREGLEPQAWPGPAQSCMLLVTFGETLVVSLWKPFAFHPPTLWVLRKACLRKNAWSSAWQVRFHVSSLSLDLVPSQKHICHSPTESTAEVSALPSLELGKKYSSRRGKWEEMTGKGGSKRNGQKKWDGCVIPAYRMGLVKKRKGQGFCPC